MLRAPGPWRLVTTTPARRHPAQAACRPVLAAGRPACRPVLRGRDRRLNIASVLPNPGELALEGTAALAAGGWCGLSFWRHAHCLVTGAGWLALSLLAFAEARLGHSVIGGHERTAFAGVLLAGVAFEGAWQIARSTNAMTNGSPRPRRSGC